MTTETRNEISYYRLVKQLCEKLKTKNMKVSTAFTLLAQHFDIIINDRAYQAIRCNESEELVAISEISAETGRREIKRAKEKSIKMIIYMQDLTIEIIISQIENKPEDIRIFVNRDTIECIARCD